MVEGILVVVILFSHENATLLDGMLDLNRIKL